MRHPKLLPDPYPGDDELEAARSWLLDLGWANQDAEEMIMAAGDDDIVIAIASTYEGGWSQFRRDAVDVLGKENLNGRFGDGWDETLKQIEAL